MEREALGPRQCLFCKLSCDTRDGLFQHLLDAHAFNVGLPVCVLLVTSHRSLECSGSHNARWRRTTWCLAASTWMGCRPCWTGSSAYTARRHSLPTPYCAATCARSTISRSTRRTRPGTCTILLTSWCASSRTVCFAFGNGAQSCPVHGEQELGKNWETLDDDGDGDLRDDPAAAPTCVTIGNGTGREHY